MAAPLFKNVLFAAGGDVLAKYATPVWRKGLQARGGETAYTFARTGSGLYLANDLNVGGLRVLTAAGGILRFDQMIDPLTGLLQSYLKLEATATNTILQSQAMATSPWSQSSTLTATNNNVTAPDGTVTGTTLLPTTTSSNNHSDNQAFTITAGENLAVGMFVRNGGYNAVVIQVVDSATNNNGFILRFDTSTGLYGTNTNVGTGTLVGTVTPVALGNKWWWIGGWGTIGGSVTAAILLTQVYDTIAHANAGTAYAGDGVSSLTAWQAQIERNGTGGGSARPPSSVIATAGATANRADETWTVPAPWGPQAMWVYLRFLEVGNAAANAAGVFSLANATESGALDSFVIRSVFAGGSYALFHGTNASSVTVQTATVPTYGQVCELLGLLNTDGSVTLRQSINGAADTVAGPSGGQAFGTPWTTLRLNGNNGFWANIGRSVFSRVVLGLGTGPTSIADVRNAL